VQKRSLAARSPGTAGLDNLPAWQVPFKLRRPKRACWSTSFTTERRIAHSPMRNHRQVINHPILCVIGNGPGSVPPGAGSYPCVTFNQATLAPLSEGGFQVANRRIARRTSKAESYYISSSQFTLACCATLQRALHQAAAELEAQLGCLPTTGFATTWALFRLGVPQHLYRMPLRPNLFRPAELSRHTPLPAAFHNWLGERRLAWQHLHLSPVILSWQQLPFSSVTAAIAQCDTEIKNPCRAVAAWFESNAGTPNLQAAEDLRRLASLPLGAWIRSADTTQLQLIESFFFLGRESGETPNWWLYNNELSPSINHLLLRLMQAQQWAHLSRMGSVTKLL